MKLIELKHSVLECYLAVVGKLVNRSTSPCKLELVSTVFAEP